MHRVLASLVEEPDPTSLDALAQELGAKYPMAASQVRERAAALRSSPRRTVVAEAPVAATGAPRRAEATRAPAASAPDMSDAALVLQAAMKAYAEETDPTTLEGFADSIRAKFPTGAILLFGRARELRATQTGGSPHVTGPGGQGSLALPALPLGAAPFVAASAAPTYVVRAGDTPALIAEHLVRDANRWPELVAANPGKPTSPSGSFASLRQGETLTLPSSWAAAAAPQEHPAPSHVEGQS